MGEPWFSPRPPPILAPLPLAAVWLCWMIKKCSTTPCKVRLPAPWAVYASLYQPVAYQMASVHLLSNQMQDAALCVFVPVRVDILHGIPTLQTTIVCQMPGIRVRLHTCFIIVPFCAEAGQGQGRVTNRGRKKEVSGELALVPPLLGSSQRLLNRSHYEVYYEVTSHLITSLCTHHLYCKCLHSLWS